MIDLNLADGTYAFDPIEGIRDVAADLAEGFIVAVGALTDLAELSPADLFGKWTDSNTGRVFWDRVTHFTDLSTAISAGRSIGELAIWDLSAGAEIRL